LLKQFALAVAFNLRDRSRCGESEQDQLIEVIVGDLGHGVPTESAGELRHAPMLPEQHDPLSVRVKGLAKSLMRVGMPKQAGIRVARAMDRWKPSGEML
jgi:hypothetical protein